MTADSRPPCAVFDLDGVLADVRHRLHHLAQRPKDWTGFFAAMTDDQPLAEGLELVAAQAGLGHRIVYLTGRNEHWRTETEDWLERVGAPSGPVCMRPLHDRRPAVVYKLQALRRLAASNDVLLVVDDDEVVVERLAAEGWNVLHATWMDHDAGGRQLLLDAQEKQGRT